MKKRILGLALVLIMIISLLPMTALAEDPTTPLPVLTLNGQPTPLAAGETHYVAFEADDANGMKPVAQTTKPQGGYIELKFADGVLNILVDSVQYDFVDVSSGGTEDDNKDFPAFFTITNTEGSARNYDIVVTLKGDSVFDGLKASMNFDNDGNVTFTGDGTLTINTTEASSKTIGKTGTGNVTVLNTTLKINHKETCTGQVYGIYSANDIVIEGSTVEIYGQKKCRALSNGTSGSIIIKYSDLIAQATSGSYVLNSANPVKFENANVTLIGATSSQMPAMKYAPEIIGVYSAQWNSSQITGEESTWKDYTALGHNAGDQFGADNKGKYPDLRFFKLVHECKAVEGAVANDCTQDVKCACGRVMVPGADAHIPGAGADDCTKDTMCGNPGCAQKYADKMGTSHVADQDDGDCTTPIKCTNTGCTQNAVEGAAKHDWNRADCSVAGTCKNTGCTQSIEAGVHSGGTATCKDKAKCEECGAEYGELGACAPAADDGDCTTEIKCSVCGKTTTAGEAAHKYTDKNDTTCDNAGCTNTRKVEGTENPKTGDNSAIAVVAALMVTAAAAFVTTKKFAR